MAVKKPELTVFPTPTVIKEPPRLLMLVAADATQQGQRRRLSRRNALTPLLADHCHVCGREAGCSWESMTHACSCRGTCWTLQPGVQGSDKTLNPEGPLTSVAHGHCCAW